MTTAFDLIDPPELVGIEYQTIEDFDGHGHSAGFPELGARSVALKKIPVT